MSYAVTPVALMRPGDANYHEAKELIVSDRAVQVFATVVLLGVGLVLGG